MPEIPRQKFLRRFLFLIVMKKNQCQYNFAGCQRIELDAVKLDKGFICCSCSEKLKNPQEKLICSRCGRGIRPGYEEQCDNCDDGVFHLRCLRKCYDQGQ